MVSFGIDKVFDFLHNVFKMKSIAKLPLYLGIAVFVISVLFSAIKVGERGILTSQGVKATIPKASLSLNFSSPNMISVLLNAEKEVAGIDAVIKFESGKINILPSTLQAGNSFITSGGTVDRSQGTFSFSALAKSPVSTGIVANFKIVPSKNLDKVQSELKFVEGTDGTAVIDKSTSQNVLYETSGVKFSLSK